MRYRSCAEKRNAVRDRFDGTVLTRSEEILKKCLRKKRAPAAIRYHPFLTASHLLCHLPRGTDYTESTVVHARARAEVGGQFCVVHTVNRFI